MDGEGLMVDMHRSESQHIDDDDDGDYEYYHASSASAPSASASDGRPSSLSLSSAAAQVTSTSEGNVPSTVPTASGSVSSPMPPMPMHSKVDGPLVSSLEEAINICKQHRLIEQFKSTRTHRLWRFGDLINKDLVLTDLMEFHEYTQKMDEPTPFSIKNLSELELTLPLPLVECPEDKHGDINTTENESAHIPDASVPSETMTQTVNETQHDYPDTDSKSQPKDPGQGLEAVIETQLPNQSDLDGESLSQGMDCDDPGDGPGDVGDQMDQMDVESAEMVEPHTKAAEVDADAAKGSDSIQDSLRRFLNPDDSIDMSNLLTNAASFYIKKAREISSQSMLSLPKGELTLASLCAGSGTGELAFHATVHQLSEEFLKPLDAKVLFCCEKVPWKQQYLMANIVSKDTCVFDDVVTLGALADRKFPLPPLDCTATDAAVDTTSSHPKTKQKVKDHKLKAMQYCVQHKRACDPRGSDIFLLKSGFSCKGNSRMNVRFSEFRESFKNEDFSNCSVSTFFGTMGTIAATKPKLVILENVDSIGNEHVQDSNLCKVCEEIKAVDEAMYDVRVYNLNTNDYILPQSRTFHFRVNESCYAVILTQLKLI